MPTTFYSYRGMTVNTDSLDRYIDSRLPVGDFLRSVLENDLKGAVGRADSVNLYVIPAYVAYLYNRAPAECWGSPAAVNAWLSRVEVAQ